jgi:class 3 adenylate cyclase
MVEEIMRRNTEMDVRAALPAIAAPTLVMHATGDPVVPVRHARFMAEHIPGARYMEYEAASHATWQVDLGSRQGFDPRPDLRGFFVGESDAPTAGTDRVLATVVFTDIVASTEQGAAVGDSRWRELLDHHDRAAQSEVARFKGRLVKSTGDGVLATFDGPARGIKCAQALGQRMAAFGLDIRAGVHTGEIELRGADVAGLGVAIARRICDLAERGELLASRTVKDLVAGSGIAFADRGPHQLKGVPDDWQLFAVG